MDRREDYSIVIYYLPGGDPTKNIKEPVVYACLLYTSPSPRDRQKYRMPSSA